MDEYPEGFEHLRTDHEEAILAARLAQIDVIITTWEWDRELEYDSENDTYKYKFKWYDMRIGESGTRVGLAMSFTGRVLINMDWPDLIRQLDSINRAMQKRVDQHMKDYYNEQGH